MAKRIIETKFDAGKRMERPEILADKYSKVDLLKQSDLLSKNKKGKKGGDISQLPPGVQESVRKKEIIEKVTRPVNDVSAAAIKKNYAIDLMPIDRKKARAVREERVSKFIEARKTGKTIELEELNRQLKVADEYAISHLEQLDTTPAKSRTQLRKEAEKKAALEAKKTAKKPAKEAKVKKATKPAKEAKAKKAPAKKSK